MSGLEQANTSYVILSADNLDSLVSVLYAKEYQLLPMQVYYQGKFEESVMAFKMIDNDDLRRDVVFMLDHFNSDSAIIKYFGETEPKKLSNNGSEHPLEVVMYNTNESNKSYIHNGISFSFVEKTRYWKPKTMNDLKVGMIVEYLNNNKWCEKIIKNPEEEWNKMFALLTKYEKVRIAQNRPIYS
jgi:hypothetical protein